MEQAVLATLIQNNDQYASIAELIEETDFLHPAHRIIFRSIAELATSHQPFDVITLAEWLMKPKLLDEVGGLRYLGALNKVITKNIDISTYARHIHDAACLWALQDKK